jgi:hypothetical protein
MLAAHETLFRYIPRTLQYTVNVVLKMDAKLEWEVDVDVEGIVEERMGASMSNSRQSLLLSGYMHTVVCGYSLRISRIP